MAEKRVQTICTHLCASGVSSPPKKNFAKLLGRIRTVRSSEEKDERAQLLVEWEGGYHMACYWGVDASEMRDQLFLGFSDGAANMMLVDDPMEGQQRIYVQLEDPETKDRGPVFAQRTLILGKKKVVLKDIGGRMCSDQSMYLRCGRIYFYIVEEGELSQADEAYLRQLRIKTDFALQREDKLIIFRGAIRRSCFMSSPSASIGEHSNSRADKANAAQLLLTHQQCQEDLRCFLHEAAKAMMQGNVAFGYDARIAQQSHKATDFFLLASWAHAVLLITLGLSEKEAIREAAEFGTSQELLSLMLETARQIHGNLDTYVNTLLQPETLAVLQQTVLEEIL